MYVCIYIYIYTHELLNNHAFSSCFSTLWSSEPEVCGNQLRSCSALAQAAVKKGAKAAQEEKGLSMGYGFLEFQTTAQAWPSEGIHFWCRLSREGHRISVPQGYLLGLSGKFKGPIRLGL